MAHIVQPAAAPSLPTYSRRYGETYEELDGLPMASLCYREIGKVKVDCRFRLSKSKWGVMGKQQTPSGIMYMDLSFDQPADSRLKNATVLVTLEGKSRRSTKRSIHMTDCYGPKSLGGVPTHVATKQVYSITPHVNVLGNGFSGIGSEKVKSFVSSSHWSFTGQLLPGASRREEATYRTLKWELTENQFERQSTHSNVIHTAFAFHHNHGAFLLRVEINGKLQRTRDRVKDLCFPPPNRKKHGAAEMMVVPDRHKDRLDNIASYLQEEMRCENYQMISAEIPSQRPLTFQDLQAAPALDANAREPKMLSHTSKNQERTYFNDAMHLLNAPQSPTKTITDLIPPITGRKTSTKADVSMAELQKAVQYYSGGRHDGFEVIQSPECTESTNQITVKTGGNTSSLASSYIKVTNKTLLFFVVQFMVRLLNMMTVKGPLKLIPERADTDVTVSSERQGKSESIDSEESEYTLIDN